MLFENDSYVINKTLDAKYGFSELNSLNRMQKSYQHADDAVYQMDEAVQGHGDLGTTVQKPVELKPRGRPRKPYPTRTTKNTRDCRAKTILMEQLVVDYGAPVISYFTTNLEMEVPQDFEIAMKDFVKSKTWNANSSPQFGPFLDTGMIEKKRGPKVKRVLTLTEQHANRQREPNIRHQLYQYCMSVIKEWDPAMYDRFMRMYDTPMKQELMDKTSDKEKANVDVDQIRTHVHYSHSHDSDQPLLANSKWEQLLADNSTTDISNDDATNDDVHNNYQGTEIQLNDFSDNHGNAMEPVQMGWNYNTLPYDQTYGGSQGFDASNSHTLPVQADSFQPIETCTKSAMEPVQIGWSYNVSMYDAYYGDQSSEQRGFYNTNCMVQPQSDPQTMPLPCFNPPQEQQFKNRCNALPVDKPHHLTTVYGPIPSQMDNQSMPAPPLYFECSQDRHLQANCQYYAQPTQSYRNEYNFS
uniref:HMG box domain-containing protein n=1 Tax=Panagrellus redivivus TaxID=6233 RepID=A0A7E4UXK4_PANRE